MAHVAPHRWADLAAGRLSEAERARLERHAAGCARCAAARARVVAARAACAEIAATEAPSLHWDHIGARIYWVTSSEQRAARRETRRHRRPLLLLAGLAGLLVIAGAAIAIPRWLGHGHQAPRATAPEPGAVDTAATETPPVPAASALHGVVVFAQGEVTRDGAPLDFDAVLKAGTRITTGDGAVAVQFEPDSGFRLGARSSLELRRFDARRVELVLEGDVSLDLAPQPADRHFAVVTGQRQVVVRGTAFRVAYRDGVLNVACLRGKVAVVDETGDVAVAAGFQLQLAAGGLATAGQVQAVTDAEVSALRRETAIPVLPAWPEARALFETSAVLDLAGDPDRGVEVDGVDHGRGRFLLRVMSGRHQVGNAQHAEWVDAAAGSRVEVAPAPERTRAQVTGQGSAARRAQIDRALDHRRARQCLRPLEKQGLVAGSYIVFDIGVTDSGSISHLNIAKSNLSAEVARCLRDRVDEISLGQGPAATVRFRLDF